MAGRILTLQRQLRELGRLRAGLTGVSEGSGKTYPKSSRTWILTSAQRSYLDAAAEMWGGTVEPWEPQGGGPKAWRIITGQPTLDAILPSGDPLSQFYEQWTKGGCQRRCDGETELRTGQACLCRAEHGENFHLLNRDVRTRGTVCEIHTRVNVFVPDLPDIGLWRVETKGFWPSNHISGYVDLIKGQVGPLAMVPITLGIEPRTKRENGQTSQYVEIVMQVRNAPSMTQMLTSGVPTLMLGGGPAEAVRPAIGAAVEERPALAAAPSAAPVIRPDAAPVEGPDPARDGWLHQISAAATVEALREVWKQLAAAQVSDLALKKAWWDRKAAIDTAAKAAPEQAVTVAAEVLAEVMDAQVEPDRDAVWTEIMTLGYKLHGWITADVSKRFRETVGEDVTEADGWSLALFRDALKAGQVPA